VKKSITQDHLLPYKTLSSHIKRKHINTNKTGEAINHLLV